jgi:hypothetical protein
MPFCPSCHSEFRAGFTECNTCQVPLVASLEGIGPGSEVGFDKSALRLLSTFTDEAQATYVRRVLDDAGVPSVIQGGHARTVESCTACRLFVDEAYLEIAQETLESYHSPSLVTGEIEGQLDRLQKELYWIERERGDLAPHVQSVAKSIEQLQAGLNALNRELEEE